MGDEQQGAVVLQEHLLQGLAGGDVEVGRRLVEDEEVRLFQQQAREYQPGAFTAAQDRDGLVHVVAAEQEPAQIGTRVLGAEVLHVDDRVEYRPLLRQVVGSLTLEADLDVVAERRAACERRFVAEYGVEEGRLADAVRSDDGRAGTPFERKVLYVQQLDRPATVVKADFEALRREDDPARAGRARRSHGDGPVGLDGLNALHAVQALLPAQRLARTLPRTVAFDEVLLLPDELLLPHVLGLLPPFALGLEVAVLAVVALVRGELAVVDLPYLGCHLVEEVAVVRDDYEGMRRSAEEALQPAQAVEVEVVGRLVEDEQVGFRQQRLGQGCTGALAAARLVDGHVERIHLQPDAGNDTLQAVLIVVAARGLVGFEHVRVAPLGVSPTVFVGSLDGSRAQGYLGLDARYLGKSLHHLFSERSGVHVPRRLWHVAYIESVLATDGAGPGSDPAHERFQECRLALSVRPDYADAGALVYLKGDALEYIKLGKADREIGCS